MNRQELFENIIVKFSDLTNYNCYLEVVGSYAMFLHGLCEFDDVCDLDVVFHGSPTEIEKLSKFFFAIAVTSPSEYPAIKGTYRYHINLHGIDVCVFLTSESDKVIYTFDDNGENPKYNHIKDLSNVMIANSKLTFLKPIKDIIAVKVAYDRPKDSKQILRYAKNIIDMIPKKPRVSSVDNTILTIIQAVYGS